MDKPVERIAAIVKEANQISTCRQQLIDDPLAFLKARGIDVPDSSLLEISYTSGYGMFLGIDIRLFKDRSDRSDEPRDKDINSDHFLDCLSVKLDTTIQHEQSKQSS
ncbi:hypothetical protein PQR05_35035 [Paraburkholderia sediminicola]|uniref:hypothetical protein n=1 Tax=Paraburkholderia sediminicola TaxID=458836 RepID=UPI0038BDBC2E